MTQLSAGPPGADSQLLVARLVYGVFVAVTPVVLAMAVTGTAQSRSFALVWVIGVFSVLYTCRNWCSAISLNDGVVSFRCIRGRLAMPVGEIYAIVDQPAGMFTSKRRHTFVTSRGSVSTMKPLPGAEAVVAALVQAEPGIALLGLNSPRPELPVTAQARSDDRRAFSACVVLSLGWTVCGAATFMLRRQMGTPEEYGLAAGYVTVTVAAALIAPGLLRHVVSPSSRTSVQLGLFSEQVVRAGLEAFGLPARWATTVRSTMLAAPALPWLALWWTVSR